MSGWVQWLKIQDLHSRRVYERNVSRSPQTLVHGWLVMAVASSSIFVFDFFQGVEFFSLFFFLLFFWVGDTLKFVDVGRPGDLLMFSGVVSMYHHSTKHFSRWKIQTLRMRMSFKSLQRSLTSQCSETVLNSWSWTRELVNSWTCELVKWYCEPGLGVDGSTRKSSWFRLCKGLDNTYNES